MRSPRIALMVGFLSTLSLRRATKVPQILGLASGISIHALLTESDLFLRSGRMTRRYFYPRSPYGERHYSRTCKCLKAYHFYPRSPYGERRNADCNYRSGHPISIHALLTESDALIRYLINTYHHFYPRSPYGERRARVLQQKWPGQFLSTLSLRRATCITTTTIFIALKFLSTLSLRRATE